MSGWDSRIVAVALFLVAAAPADEATVRRGAAIYNGSEPSPGWRALSADLDYTYPAGTVSCAACHGEDGTGASEGGVAAPSLAAARAMEQSALHAWLVDAFAGKGRGGALLGDRMPRFEMAEVDVRALAAFMRTLPLPYQQGVTVNAVDIRMDTSDVGLSPAAIDVLRRQGEALTGSVTIFGRVPRLAVTSTPADREATRAPFLSLNWGTSATKDTLVSVQVVDESASSRCGSLLPDTERRYGLLQQWMSNRQLHAARSGSTVTLRREVGPSDPPPPAAAFDLTGRPQSPGGPSVPVVAGDLVQRMRNVRDIEAETALPVHEASVVSLFLQALRISLASLGKSGRRLSVNAVCKTLQAELARNHAITLVFEDREDVIHAAN